MTGANYDKNLINAIIEAISSGKGKFIIIDSAGNIISDKLQFDDLLALFTNRLDSLASLRKSLTIPEGSLYQVPEGQKVIVKDYVLAEGDLYVEGDLLVV